MSLSVVICAYTQERWDDLCAAVASLQRQTLLPNEIIIAIDHNPALLERVRATLSEVKVVENRETRGLSGARNSGIAAARGEIVAFMDEDAVAAPDWLERLAVAYNHPEVLGVGGAIDPQWEDKRPNWFPLEFDWVVGCTYRGMPTATTPVRNLIGCNMSLRRKVFDDIGGFRNEIGRVGKRPVGCEETELCIRAGQRWRQAIFLYDPQARVAHRVPAARARWSYFASRCYSEGISKALVARFVGAGDGLASERAHALRVLPKGVAVGISDAFLRRDLSGLGRAAAIVVGFALTALGYLNGVVALRQAPALSPNIGGGTLRDGLGG